MKEKFLVRVNLTERQWEKEPIGGEIVRQYLGGRLLGNKYLYEEVAPRIDPLSPENKLFFSAGLLTGTTAPSAGRYALHCKSPQTGLYLCTLSGGYFGPALRKTGHEMVIVEGGSETPVYVVIRPDRVAIKDADHLWGMTTDITQELIKEELGDPRARIACIGPAGEGLVPYACVINERRAAGRGGAGAVMGSKRLKAVVVQGDGEIEVANPQAFSEAVRHLYRDFQANPMIGKGFRSYGSHNAVPALTAGGIVPWRNWQDGGSSTAKALFPETWRGTHVKKDIRCFPPCNLKCTKLTVANSGPHAGAFSEGPDYEALYSFGTCCDVTDINAIIHSDSLCDRFGLDTISMGVTTAFAMECYEKGIIDRSDTGGLELSFGQGDLLPRVIRDTAFRQGFGEILCLGTKRISEKWGKGSEAFAMQVNGLELGGYDPRGAKSVALVYACGPRGGCHKHNGSANLQARMELQTGEARYVNDGKAALNKKAADRKALADSIIFCTFAMGALSDVAIVEALNAVTGFDWSVQELYEVSERGIALERLFNVREGLRRNWDTLPSRLLKESPVSGPNVGHVVDLEPLLNDLYRLRGWDLKTGIPTPENLRALGLGHVIPDIEG